MKDKKILKNLAIISIGLIGLITTLIVNNTVENDLLCILLMSLFLVIEIFGLLQIIRDKYQYRWGYNV